MGFQSVEGRGAVQLLRDESQDSCATCLGSIAHGHNRSEQHNGRLNGPGPGSTHSILFACSSGDWSAGGLALALKLDS